MGLKSLPINLSDFSSFICSVSVVNSTSSTILPLNSGIQILEFTQKGLVLSIPRANCAFGHQLILRVHVDTPQDSRLDFTATAKVIAVEDSGSSHDRVTIDFVQYEVAKFDELIACFENRQNEIVQFFKAVRGFE